MLSIIINLACVLYLSIAITKKENSMDLVEIQKKIKSKETATDDKDLKELGIKEEKPEELKFAKRVETFNVSYIDDDGKTKKSKITSKVMDYETRLRYDRALSELSGGLIFDSLPFETKNKYICMARAITQIIDPPEWFLQKVGEDLEFCFSIGGKLIDHESRFFRHNSGENMDGETKPRFQID